MRTYTKFSSYLLAVIVILSLTLQSVQPAHASPNISNNVPATTWYVATTGNDANDCASPASPCLTISGALGKAAASGDIINVTSGIYTGSGAEVLIINKSIVLSGGWDAAFTTQNGMSSIDGQMVRNGITINDLSFVVTIERFIIKNSGDNRYGIVSSGTVTLNKIHAYNNGRAVYNMGVMTINNSSFTNNGSLETCGGAIMNSGWNVALVINNSTISNNSSRLTDCFSFWGATSGLLNSGGTATLNNTTISNNTNGSIWSYYPTNSTSLQNSLVTGNKFDNGEAADCYSGDILNSLGYNIIGVAQCSLNSAPGDQIGSSISPVNPQLGVLIGSPAYSPLRVGSPAIDNGNPGGCTGNTGVLNSDQRGASRVGRCDIGAYEYTAPGPAIGLSVVSGDNQRSEINFAIPDPFQAAALDSLGSPVSGVSIDFTAPASDATGTFANTGTNATSAITDSDGVATSSIFTTNNHGGIYTISASATGLGSVNFNIQNVAWSVSPTGNDSNTCLSTDAPCLTINGAIIKATAGDKIRVAVGTYTDIGTEVVHVNKSVILLGGWDATFSTQNGVSTIDGQGARIGIVVDHSAIGVLDRFAIQNGAGCTTGGIRVLGGSTTLTLNNSILNSNTATCVGGGVSGGISNDGYTTINNSTISNNIFGGINNSGGTLTLNNSTISGNHGNGISGGGLNNSSLATINNSTISDNTIIGNSGAGIYNSGTLTLNNATVNNNNAVNGSGGGIWNRGYGSTVTLLNTIVAMNTSGTGMYSLSPDCGGAINSSGYNLIGNNSGCTLTPATGDLVGTAASPIDPGLAPLQDNGGSTFTHALVFGSPAINAGNPAVPGSGGDACLAADQRGITRPMDSACDMGAYEYEFDPSAPKVIQIKRINPIPTNVASVDFAVTFSKSVTGVDAGDFAFAMTGSVTGATVSGVAGGPMFYTVTVATGNGEGTLRLDVTDNDTILDLAGNPLGDPGLNNGDFTTGEFYTIDRTAPTVDIFTVPSTVNGLSIPITAFTASDAVGVTGYLITESATAPAAGATGWTGTAPAAYTVASGGSHTLYPWTKDESGNVSSVFATPRTVEVDAPPTVDTFTITGWTFPSLNIPITAFTATDDIGVTGYLITETSTPPASGADGWTGTAPTSFTVSSSGFHVLYPWARDTSGNVSAVFAFPPLVVVSPVAPSVTSITRVNPSPTNLASVDFTVTFSKPVTGVDVLGPTFDDFSLTTSSGISGASVSSVSGSDTTYTVTVNTGSGNGTLRLNVGTGGHIVDLALNPLAGGFTTGDVYTIIKTATFGDVPTSYWASTFIERLYSFGVTGGCSTIPLNYCPAAPVTRAQMAIFILRAEHGAAFNPPAATGSVFLDVPNTYWAAKWIEALSAEGITGGCGSGNYCPDTVVTRDQMAVFLLRGEHTSSYTPPAMTGSLFADVPAGYWAGAWIEALAAEGITGGCGNNNYCPTTVVTRDQMAVFLVRAFNLP